MGGMTAEPMTIEQRAMDIANQVDGWRWLDFGSDPFKSMIVGLVREHFHAAITQYCEERVPGLDDLPMTTRLRNVLMGAGITTMDKLLAKSRDELLQQPGFGPRTLRVLEEELGALGLRLHE